MRTTLDIDQDVLEAVKERADSQGKSAGKVVSELVRLAILGPEVSELPASGGLAEEPQDELAGKPKVAPWPTFPRTPGESRVIVTSALVRRLLEKADLEDAGIIEPEDGVSTDE